MKLVFIDGNNLAIRQAFAQRGLAVRNFSPIDHPDDFNPTDSFPTGVLHGFFKSLVMLRQRFPDRYFVVVWDAGHRVRTKLSQQGVADGLIPEGYKENRRREAPKQEILDFLKQKPQLMKAITFTNIPQVLISGEEADDAIASYVSKYTGDCENALIVTEDKDYYQLLTPNAMLFRENDLFTESDFVQKYNLAPWQWVEMCSLSGDARDNIFGIPGWGEETSKRAIQAFASLNRFYDHLEKKHAPLLEKFPNLPVDQLSLLGEFKTPAGSKRYENICADTNYTGVALALEQKMVKIPRSELLALMHKKVALLAHRLKKMRIFPVHDLPGFGNVPPLQREMKKEFLDFCWQYKLQGVANDADLICARQMSKQNAPVEQKQIETPAGAPVG